jgi:chemotaxis protein histidine kinase CheA
MTDNDPRTLPECEDQAVSKYFEGDRALFMAFRTSCVAQFDVDLAEAEAAIEDRDAAVLRRVAHSLKAVLLTIGYNELSDVAKLVEHAAHQNHWESAVNHWQQFSQDLRKAFGI